MENTWRAQWKTRRKSDCRTVGNKSDKEHCFLLLLLLRQGKAPCTTHHHTRASHYSAIIGPAQNWRAFLCWAPLPLMVTHADPCCPTFLPSTQVVFVTGGGCHSRKMKPWDTNSNAKAWSIAKALVTKTKISYLQRIQLWSKPYLWPRAKEVLFITVST